MKNIGQKTEESPVYVSPGVDVIYIDVEQGFAFSVGGWEDGGSSEDSFDI